MGLAEAVAAGDERHRLLVIHRHARKGLTDIAGGGDRIGIAVRTFGVDIDQAHLHRAQRSLQLALAAVALIAEPRPFRAPVEFLGLPGVDAAAGEAERLEAHRFERHVAGQDVEVGHEILRPYFCLIGQSSRRALSRLALSGQLFSGAKRCCPPPAPPRPSAMR
jgi:hypothetical protein